MVALRNIIEGAARQGKVGGFLFSAWVFPCEIDWLYFG